MEVFELYDLTKWVDQKVDGDEHGNLLNLYQNFINALDQSRRGQHSFKNERETLEKALKTISFSSLTRDQTDFLKKYNMFGSLGQGAVDTIDEILTDNRLDIDAVIEEMKEMRAHLSDGIDKLAAIHNGLSDYIPDDYDRTQYFDGVLTRLSFREDVSINNVVDFKNAAEDWHLIGRGLAAICDVNPEDIKIIGASRGSIIFDLFLTWSVAKIFNQIIAAILNNTKTIYEIKKICAEIQSANLDNKRKSIILKELTGSEEDEKKKSIDKTVGEVTTQLKIANDKLSSLTKAVGLISKFLERGGQIDFVLPPQTNANNDDENQQDTLQHFRQQVQETRLLLETVKQIKHAPEESATSQDVQSDDDEGQT